MHGIFNVQWPILAIWLLSLWACVGDRETNMQPHRQLLNNYVALCLTARVDDIVSWSLSATYLCPPVSDDEAHLWREVISSYHDTGELMCATTNSVAFATNWQMQRRAGLLFLLEGNRREASRALYRAWQTNTNDVEALFLSVLLSIKTYDTNAYSVSLSALETMASAVEHAHLLRAIRANSVKDYATSLEQCRTSRRMSALNLAWDYCELEARYFGGSKPGEIKKLLERMSRQDYSGADINQKIAYAAIRAGNADAAYLSAMRAIDCGGTNRALYEIAIALAHHKRDYAMECVLRRQILFMFPSDLTNRIFLVRSYALRKEYGAARLSAWQINLINSNAAASLIKELLL